MHSRIAAAALALASWANAVPVEERAATSTLSFWPSYTGQPSIASACASVHNAQATSTASTIYIKPSYALACLMSVPVDVENDIAFIEFLLPYYSYQSTLGDLKDPPKGYLYPGVDIIGGLQEIREKLRDNKYTNQYEFTQELSQLMKAGNDGHMAVYPNLNNVFVFKHGLSLAAASPDGLQLPSIFEYSDLLNGYAGNGKATPIASIDGIDIQTWVENVGYLLSTTQDPDASYNAMLQTIPFQSTGNGQYFLSGWPSITDSSNVTFANGSWAVYENTAVLNRGFQNVTTGEDLHAIYELPTSPISARSVNEDLFKPLSRRASATMGPGYPSNSVVIHNEAYMAGYFLGGAYSDTCVLAMTSFQGGNDYTASMYEVRRVIQSLIQQCKDDNRDKLVIDLSANGGGQIFQGYELYRNLFPNSTNWSGARLRAHPTLNTTGVLAYGSSWETNLLHNVTDADGKRFTTWEDLYGPSMQGNDPQTNIMLLDFEDGTISGNKTDPIWVTGYGGQEPISEQPFKAENIIIVTDGFCASTCTIFTGLMTREAGVRTIAVGGRPLNKPMQAMGGTKGSNDLTLATIGSWSYNIVNAKQVSLIPADELAVFPEVSSPLQPTTLSNLGKVNWRNAYSQTTQDGSALQFIYEAANCRLFPKPSYLVDISNLWVDAANVTWHGGQCVSGSTVNKDNTIGSTTPAYTDSVLSTVQGYAGPGSNNAAWTALLTNTTGTDATLPGANITSTTGTTGTSSPTPTNSNAATGLGVSGAAWAMPVILAGGLLAL